MDVFPAVVTVRVAVAALAPGVTELGEMLHTAFDGAPLHVRRMALLNVPPCGEIDKE